MTFAEALNELNQNPDKTMSRPVMEALVERVAVDMEIQYAACRRSSILGEHSDYVYKMWAEFARATQECDRRIKKAVKEMQHTSASAGAR